MSDAYDLFARAVREGGVITDPWANGEPRLREEPVILDARRAAELAHMAEDIGALYDELCHVVADAPELLDDFFGLTPVQKALWLGSQPLWHGIARADVFETDDGLVAAELNCDTPTGEPEAVVLGALAAAARPGAIDPVEDLARRFVAMVDAVTRSELEAPVDAPAIGIVYPTEFTEDLALVRLYRGWFEARGRRVALGSPFNLRWDGERLSLFDAPIDVVIRHYKTDWWGERQSVWTDEAFPDAEPLVEPLRAVFSAMAARKVAVVNPFGAVVPQNKRAMALFWEHIHRFSAASQRTIQRFVPVTSRLERVHEAQLVTEREQWVLKSDYGAEGDEVILGKLTTDATWKSTIERARPGRWIAQRYFEAHVDAAGEALNLGVFLVAGEAAGFYARVQAGATNDEARSAAVLVEP
ncbi:MAG TPA: glutathionylspermidine synthase family protein [Byssovorax sp.]